MDSAYSDLSAVARKATLLPSQNDSKRSSAIHTYSGFTAWLFLYLSPMLAKGLNAPLQECDLPRLPTEHSAERWLREVCGEWDAEALLAARQHRSPSLWRVSWAVRKSAIIKSGILCGITVGLNFAVLAALTAVIGFLNGEGTSFTTAVISAALLFVCSVAKAVLRHLSFGYLVTIAMDLQSGTLGLLYSKVVRVTCNISKGAVMTLVSTDTNRIRELAHNFHNVWAAPLTVFIAIGMSSRLLGVAVLPGIAVALCVVPVNWRASRMFSSVTEHLMLQQQQRMQRLSEILEGILVVKLFSWEHSMAKRVTAVRDKELTFVKRYSYGIATIMSVILSASSLMSVASFATYAAMGNTLTADIVFPILYLFNMMTFPMIHFPYVVSTIMSTATSFKRIQKFLEQPESVETHVSPADTGSSTTAAPITVTSATFAWQKSDFTEASDDAKGGESAACWPASLTCCQSKASVGHTSSDYVALNTASSGPVGQESESTLLPPSVSNVSLTVRRGELIAIVGAVGAGKSTLLSGLLGEVVNTAAGPVSSVLVDAKVVYCPQQAWIRSATIRDNILFGIPMMESRYKKVIASCALGPDLDIFPLGDMTEVGERGVTLSGGQKQRLSIARAMYSVLTSEQHTLCLLDDPLSAVDAHVGEHLFNEAICGVLRNQTRVLVTHQLQFLPQVDRIIVMDKGRVLHEGSYVQLMAAGVSFASLAAGDESPQPQSGPPDQASVHSSPRVTSSDPLSAMVPMALRRSSSTGSDASDDLTPLPAVSLLRSSSTDSTPGKSAGQQVAAMGQAVQLAVGKAVEEEERYVGTVQASVYKMYMKSLGGLKFAIPFAILSIALECVRTGTSLWLAAWADDPQADIHKQMAVYVSLGVLTSILSLIRNFGWFHATYLASRKLHARMLGSVIRAPMGWFNATPQGRILNRFSKDLDVIDQNLPDVISDFILCAFEALFMLITMTIASPLLLILIPLMMIAYYRLTQMYRCSSREIKRMESITNSFVHSHFSETVDGLSTIRSFRCQEQEIKRLVRLKDRNSTVSFVNVMTDRWIGQRIESLSSIIILAVALLSVCGKQSGVKWLDTNSAVSSLAVLYAVNLTETFNWMIRTATQGEAEMSRVERVLHYSSIPPEAPLFAGEEPHTHSAVTGAVVVGEDPVCSPADDVTARTRQLITPPVAWPRQGCVEFRNVVMRYRDNLDPVLKGVTFLASPGQKVGIVGRTGAGKSSIMLSLFRIVEIESGAVLIDGVDVGKLGLRRLRSSISIIPQSPVLFSGTIRSNLMPDVEEVTNTLPKASSTRTAVDLADVYVDVDLSSSSHSTVVSDARLWAVLHQVGLGEYVKAQPLGLDTPVDEKGQNLSAGQRQLVCLGRALLRNSKILVMDEATASCDPDTDNLIQRTVRQHFRDVTILTVAHRLPTIIDYDKVLVMNAGVVAEYDTPHALLHRPDGIFNDMVESTGPESASFLRSAAERAASHTRTLTHL